MGKVEEGNTVSDRSVLPEQFGRFLSLIFDEWVQHDVGTVFVQTFEASLRNWLGMPSSGMCVFNETCGLGVALEHNGDLYSCDHFVEPDFLLGNIQQEHMIDLVASPEQRQFGVNKRSQLPQYCLNCDVRFACHGGCPKNRFRSTPDGEPGLNYLCAGYKQFFGHIDEPMRMMCELLREGRAPAELPDVVSERESARFAAAGRNDPCPCGSGAKYKRCHGT